MVAVMDGRKTSNGKAIRILKESWRQGKTAKNSPARAAASLPVVLDPFCGGGALVGSSVRSLRRDRSGDEDRVSILLDLRGLHDLRADLDVGRFRLRTGVQRKRGGISDRHSAIEPSDTRRLVRRATALEGDSAEIENTATSMTEQERCTRSLKAARG